jgi:hypothetical protein
MKFKYLGKPEEKKETTAKGDSFISADIQGSMHVYCCTGGVVFITTEMVPFKQKYFQIYGSAKLKKLVRPPVAPLLRYQRPLQAWEWTKNDVPGGKNSE